MDSVYNLINNYVRRIQNNVDKLSQWNKGITSGKCKIIKYEYSCVLFEDIGFSIRLLDYPTIAWINVIWHAFQKKYTTEWAIVNIFQWYE